MNNQKISNLWMMIIVYELYDVRKTTFAKKLIPLTNVFVLSKCQLILM